MGNILAIVIEQEIGSIDRFDTSGQFSRFAGFVPTVHASSGNIRLGHMRKPSNQNLKWAFRVASRSAAQGHRSRHRHHPAWKTKCVRQIYDQASQRKGHAVAVGAVARHLAQGAFWILNRQQPYRPPASRQASPKQVRGRAKLVPTEARELIAWRLLNLLMPH